MSLSLTSYKGTRDLYPVDMMVRNYIFDQWRSTVERYGYQEYMAPILEPLEIYAAKSGQEIVNDQTYSFQDRGGRQVVIRPEMTPSVTRLVAARRQEMAMPARLYSIANFMRYERPQHGREREFWQLNLDLFGVTDLYADIEIVKLAHDVVADFGASDQMFTIKVNDRRLTNYIMSSYLNLDVAQTVQMIKLLDRFDKLPREEFDEQAIKILGDKKILAKLDAVVTAQTIDDLPDIVKNNPVTEPLRSLFEALSSQGNLTNLVYDSRLMRGFDYYTGIVLEVFDEAPENRRSMFGGGRYDGLVSMFGVESLPITGVAPGETMFREFLLAHDLLPDFSDQGPDLTILPIANVAGANQRASQLADLIRQDDLSVSVDYTDRKIDKKTRAAVKNNAKMLAYVGEAEINGSKLPIKLVATGKQEQIPVDNVSSYVVSQIMSAQVAAMAEGRN